MPPVQAFWHDNGLTEEFIVAVASPYLAKLTTILAAAAGWGNVGHAFEWDPAVGAKVFCVQTRKGRESGRAA